MFPQTFCDPPRPGTIPARHHPTASHARTGFALPIETIELAVRDIERSIGFYSRHLGARLVSRTDRTARLDLVTAEIELHEHPDAGPITWTGDDYVRGFRHLGFKVSDIDSLVEDLHAEAVPFWYDVHDNEDAGVRIAFFFDPDGIVFEMVQGHVSYDDVHDPVLVAEELALPDPPRPRFDHVGISSDDPVASRSFYAVAGFRLAGTISFDDGRAMQLQFLRSGQTVIELLTFPRQLLPSEPAHNRVGVRALVLQTTEPGAHERVDLRDPDGLPVALVDALA